MTRPFVINDGNVRPLMLTARTRCGHAVAIVQSHSCGTIAPATFVLCPRCDTYRPKGADR